MKTQEFDPPYHLFERHFVYPKKSKSKFKMITYERQIMKNNKVYLKSPTLITRRQAKAIVNLLNALDN